jgi:hypothetical protein
MHAPNVRLRWSDTDWELAGISLFESDFMHAGAVWCAETPGHTTAAVRVRCIGRPRQREDALGTIMALCVGEMEDVSPAALRKAAASSSPSRGRCDVNKSTWLGTRRAAGASVGGAGPCEPIPRLGSDGRLGACSLCLHVHQRRVSSNARPQHTAAIGAAPLATCASARPASHAIARIAVQTGRVTSRTISSVVGRPALRSQPPAASPFFPTHSTAPLRPRSSLRPRAPLLS